MKKFQRLSVILFLGVIVSVLLATSLVVMPVSANGYDCSTVTDVPQSECQKLVDLYDNNNGTNWYAQTNWKATTTVCDWYGIACNSGDTHVEEIYLHYNNLTGTLAVDFSGFTALKEIRLSDNSLAGDISTIFGYLPSSTMESVNLYRNQFDGTIPSITSFTNLTYLSLNSNQLTGTIDTIIPGLPTSLEGIHIGDNDQTGYIPSTISTFTGLTALDINSEGLTNNFTTLVGDLPATLEYLFLSGNSLTGTFPSDMATELPNLTYLDLATNTLSGNLTTTFGYLSTTLEYLELYNNDFTGTIPSGVSSYTSLEGLGVGYNQLDGSLTAIINNLPASLYSLYLAGNELTGTIPAAVANLTDLEYFNVAANNLTGDLATIIGYLPTGIYNLYLNENNFTGSLPASIQNFTNLSTFMIGKNTGLSGTIPMEITNLTMYRFNFYDTNLCEPQAPAYHTWKDSSVTFYIRGNCLYPFNGGVEISTGGSQIVAIGRPHIGSEIMAYSGMNAGATTVYLPMLFNNTWGNYTSSFTVQNVGAGTATFSMEFKDAKTGLTDCVVSGQSLPQHGIKTYDVTSLPACDGVGIMPVGWFGGAKISSNLAVAVVAKPNILGSDAVTYNGFTSGASTVYLPMLFRGIWGYESAFYVQNLHAHESATLDIMFYDSAGSFICEYLVTVPIQASETRGFWMSFIENSDCQSGDPGFSASGWAGNAVITVNGGGSDAIVAIARPHLGAEVAAYNGFTSGSTINYLPMLFRGKWGYTSAVYIQNLEGTASDVEIKFYDTDGNYTCTYTATDDVGANATKGYWIPYLACTTDSFPAEWAGSAKITTSNSTAVVGRPHLSGGQVVAYNAFSGGGSDVYLPMLFRQYYGNEAAIYVQNLELNPTQITFTFYDENSGEYCVYTKAIAANASGAVWLAALDGADCVQ